MYTEQKKGGKKGKKLDIRKVSLIDGKDAI
jgi:hypothetical protein